MKRVRKDVFETNSSSMHCLVIAPKDEFDKFMGGELFAMDRDYKYFGETKLVYFGEVYNSYVNFCNDYSFAKMRVSSNLLRELMNFYSVFAKGDAHGFEVDPDKVLEYNWSDEIRGEIDSLNENFDLVSTLGNVSCWLDMQTSPISYDMVKYVTENFTTGWDEYKSIPPFFQSDGTVKMHGVWYD